VVEAGEKKITENYIETTSRIKIPLVIESAFRLSSLAVKFS
jgi:hypothetical protein